MSEGPVQALLPGRHALLVRLTCQAGRRAALLDVLNTYADGLAEEPGTELFVVSVDPDDEALVWLYEMFRDEEAEQAHRAAGGFARMVQAMPDLLASPPALLRMEPLRMAMQEAVLAEDWSF
ncbi:MAG: putative quinol monooxygenase [Actinomycetota bacterium]|nr:putative quinol monooxygenase [Actinomycetota bacterium]